MEKWKDLDVKSKLAIYTAFIAFFIGWGLTIAAFIVPPLGDISDSVLFVLGQSLVYAASVFGITTYFSGETKRLKQDIAEYINERVNKD